MPFDAPPSLTNEVKNTKIPKNAMLVQLMVNTPADRNEVAVSELAWAFFEAMNATRTARFRITFPQLHDELLELMSEKELQEHEQNKIELRYLAAWVSEASLRQRTPTGELAISPLFSYAVIDEMEQTLMLHINTEFARQLSMQKEKMDNDSKLDSAH